MKYLLAAYFWSVFLVITLVLFAVVAVIHLVELMLPKTYRTRGVHWIACVWGMLLYKIFPLWRLEIKGREHLPRGQDEGMVFVANHLNAGDIFTLCNTFSQFRFLSKDAVFKLPIIGTGMRWAGYVPVKRGDKGSHATAMKRSASWLRRGVSMLFFPEGTRSRSGQLAAFKSGAFRLADENSKAILPIALSGTHRMLIGPFPFPARVKITIFPPTRRAAGESMDEYIARVHAQIASAAAP